jgi:hypothetical protein
LAAVPSFKGYGPSNVRAVVSKALRLASHQISNVRGGHQLPDVRHHLSGHIGLVSTHQESRRELQPVPAKDQIVGATTLPERPAREYSEWAFHVFLKESGPSVPLVAGAIFSGRSRSPTAIYRLYSRLSPGPIVALPDMCRQPRGRMFKFPVKRVDQACEMATIRIKHVNALVGMPPGI